MSDRPTSSAPADLLSPHVSGSRYFFLQARAPRAGSARLALGGREVCNPDYHIDRTRYAYYVLEYVAQGAGLAELDGLKSDLLPGTVFTSGPLTHCVLRTDPVRPLTKYFVCVAGRSFETQLKRAGLSVGRFARVAAHGEIRNVFEELIREGRHTGSHALRVCELLLEVLLLKIADGIAQHVLAVDAARDNFLRCKALVDAQADRLHSLEDLASAASLETSSVCRLFRRFQGTSPYQYLLRCKMNLAAEHLLGSGMLVKEAAERVGFSDPYHFSRCFKAVHGLAPRELRRSKS